jgi:uncharacterized iron-regulated membrane protein
MTFWRQGVRHPQDLLLRRAVFKVHLWTDIGLGLYVLVIGVSGSLLVYRNELYRTFSPQPVVVEGSGESMTLDALKSAAATAYPDFEVTGASAGDTPNHAVEITLKRGEKVKRRLIHPFTGKDLGDPAPSASS